jgi:hypothetical protein
MGSWLSKGAKAAFGVFGAIATAVGLWVDTTTSGLLWIPKVAAFAIAVAFFSPLLLELWRRLIAKARSFREVIRRGRDYQRLEEEMLSVQTRAGDIEEDLSEATVEVNRWKQTAAKWQERADKFSELLADWDSATLLEGRGRVLGELLGKFAGTTFSDTAVKLDEDGNVVIGAKIFTGHAPPLRSLFFIEEKVFHDPKAAIECFGYADAETPLFKIRYLIDMPEEVLLTAAKELRGLPSNLIISARSVPLEEFYTEKESKK